MGTHFWMCFEGGIQINRGQNTKRIDILISTPFYSPFYHLISFQSNPSSSSSSSPFVFRSGFLVIIGYLSPSHSINLFPYFVCRFLVFCIWCCSCCSVGGEMG